MFEASFGANPETAQLQELASEYDTFDKILAASQVFEYDCYSFIQDLQYIAKEKEHQFLYIFFRNTDLAKIRDLNIAPDSSGVSPIVNGVRSEFAGLDYTCFKVNGIAFDNYLTEEFKT